MQTIMIIAAILAIAALGLGIHSWLTADTMSDQTE